LLNEVAHPYGLTLANFYFRAEVTTKSGLFKGVDQMNFEVHRLLPGDEQVALQVVRDLMPEDERDGREPSLPQLNRFLAQDTNYLIIASKGDVPVGFLTAYRMPALCCDASMVYIFEIEVALPLRRQGIGKGMVNLLKALCLESDVEDIWVGTENDNVAAKRLYESTGGICSYPDTCEFTYLLKN
jgi:GNAT superfamily N-acetyltransferase